MQLVWDAATKPNGTSLNDFIHAGPDLLNPLCGCGDIAEMFHRINVQESDTQAQRFLWWDKIDNSHVPSTYVMTALKIGIRFGTQPITYAT